MHHLRSTVKEHRVETHPVVLEVSHLGSQGVDLLFSWIEIWLNRHCKSPWTLDVLEETNPRNNKARVFLCVRFEDVREALYFKLGPQYSAHQPTHAIVKYAIIV